MKKPNAIVSYKGFNANWKCRDFQFEVGKSYEHMGDVEACSSGFHACEYPLHVLKYYRPNKSVFAVVSQSGILSRHDEDTKVASSKLTVTAQIDLRELIEAAVKYTLGHCKPVRGGTSNKKNTAVKAVGANKSATASGYYGAATASGEYGAATASGESGAATASGESGAATASGYYGAATASGYYGAATASGYYGAATASGKAGAATASGANSAALASGINGRVSGIEGSALFLVGRGFGQAIIHVWAGIVGRDGIKADTFYTLDANGKPVQVK